MLQETLRVDLIDQQRIDELKEDSTPDDDLYGNLVHLFETSVQNSLKNMTPAIAQSDWRAVRALSHKVRNTSGNAGARRLHTLATQFELNCESFDPQLLEEWLTAFQSTFLLSLQALKEQQ